MRDARKEAFDRLGGRYEVRVLEPSPPAVGEGPWFADDPAERGEVPDGRQVVSAVSSGDILWNDLAAGDPELAAWCADRWLGPWRRLGPLPEGFAETRLALHKLTEEVLSPARERANGKIALRWTLGGFGTPFFGEDTQLRVEGDELVTQGPGGETRERLDVDARASRALGDWFGFTASVLEELRAGHPELEPSRVQLWAEHFDIATELGPEADGHRAGFGGSPGDGLHPEPYLYVVPWKQDRAAGPLWNSEAFRGAELSYADVLAANDQRAAALAFFEARLL